MKLDELSRDMFALLDKEGPLTQAEIRNKLFPKYSKKHGYDEATFKTIVWRRSERLLGLDLIEKKLGIELKEKKYEKAKVYLVLKPIYKELAMNRLSSDFWKDMSERMNVLVRYGIPRAYTSYFHQMDFNLSFGVLHLLKKYFTLMRKGQISQNQGKEAIDAYIEVSFSQYRELLYKLINNLAEANEQGKDVESMLQTGLKRYEKDHELLDKKIKTFREKLLTRVKF